MGNIWKGISDEAMYESEKALWVEGGIDLSWVTVKNVHLGGDDPENYIRQFDILPETEGLPLLIVLHGFGGGGPVCGRMALKLRAHFRIIAIDMLGLAGSGRPDYHAFGYEKAKLWHLYSINTWVKKAAIKEPFHITGHSFGGFIACLYALQYSEQILSVILLSAVGVTS